MSCTNRHSNDFEGADPLAGYTEITDIEVVAGIGVGGSTGFRGTGSDVQKVFAELTKPVSGAGRGGCAEVATDLRHSVGSAGFNGFSILEFRRAFGHQASLYVEGGTDTARDLVVYQNWGGTTEIGRIPGAALVGTTHHVYRLECCLSSIVATDTDLEPQADGLVRVYRDGALLLTITTARIGGGFEDNVWDRVAVSPIGHGDHFQVGDGEACDLVVLRTGVDQSTGCPCPGPPPVMGAGAGLHIAPWVAQCLGGGTVPAGPDLAVLERWDD